MNEAARIAVAAVAVMEEDTARGIRRRNDDEEPPPRRAAGLLRVMARVSDRCKTVTLRTGTGVT